ncbi:MAG: RNA polymerase sigma factor [Candidatus Sumerlaeia bacterium]|nr:RNA polymerase sigma factor [Candidatus Sumerlaeia bacterium]
MEELTDAELMRRLRKGDNDAFTALVERHEQPLLRFLWGLLQDAEEARDVAQDAFLQAYRHREKYNPAMSFRTWLFTIGRNRAISLLRQRKFRGQLPDPSPYEEDAPDPMLAIPDPGENPREQLLRSEDARWLRLALQRLDDKHRQVIEMKYLGGMKSREIADLLGLEVGTVWSRVHHGLKKLKAVSAEMNYEW